MISAIIAYDLAWWKSSARRGQHAPLKTMYSSLPLLPFGTFMCTAASIAPAAASSGKRPESTPAAVKTRF